MSRVAFTFLRNLDYSFMRLEKFEEAELEENTIGETEEYLNSLLHEEDTVEETEAYLESLVYIEESEVEA